jgi:hypothetical protein
MHEKDTLPSSIASCSPPKLVEQLMQRHHLCHLDFPSLLLLQSQPLCQLYESAELFVKNGYHTQLQILTGHITNALIVVHLTGLI